MSLEMAAGATSETAVIVTGAPSESLPSELQFLGSAKVFENRYGAIYHNTTSPNSFNTSQQMTFNIWNADQFNRMRTCTLGVFYNVAPVNVQDLGFDGDTAITPMWGIGVTYWDTVSITFGNSNQSVYTKSTDASYMAYMRFWAYMDDCITAKHWQELAGMYRATTFDYGGGVMVTRGNSTYVQYNQNTPQPGGYYKSEIPFINKPSQDLAIPPNGQWVLDSSDATQTGAGGLRQFEIGYWLDEAMNRYRVNTTGRRTTTGFTTLTKMDMFTDVFNTIYIIPPMKQSLQLIFNKPNSSRPRYILTPQLVQIAGNPTTQTLVETSTQSTYAGITIDQSKCYYYNDSIVPRADIAAIFLTTWRSGYGINDSFVSYGWASFDITSSNTTIKVVNAGNFVGFKACYALYASLPYSQLDGNARAAQNCNYSEFAFGEQPINEITYCTTVNQYNRFQDFFYNNSIPNTDSYDAWTLLEANVRGILDFYNSWTYSNIVYQGITVPEPRDYRDDCFWQTHRWFTRQMPPAGSYQQDPTDEPIWYGSHAFRCIGHTYSWNIGRQNQIYHVIFAPLGFDDKAYDFGTTNASLEYQVKLKQNPCPNLKFFHFMAYNQNITYLGTGDVFLTLPIS